MTRAVSFLLPTLDLPELLEKNLPPLLDILEARDVGDEVVVIDDTGTSNVARFVRERFPACRAIARERNGGFARAVTSGVEAAINELVFSMNTDVRVHPGFLEPLIETISREEVGAVTPRVRLDGEEGDLESVTQMSLERGLARFLQPNLESSLETPVEFTDRPIPVGFAVGGTLLMEKATFLEVGGFDPVYEPFYWEDIDLSWKLWKRGFQVLMDPRSVVDHMHQSTIGSVVPRELIRCMQRKNRYAFTWRHLSNDELRESLPLLANRIVDASLQRSREELVGLCYALEDLEAILAGRREGPGFAELAERLAD